VPAVAFSASEPLSPAAVHRLQDFEPVRRDVQVESIHCHVNRDSIHSKWISS
jgi:hypothetical protein